jgi:hypothetical protein
MVTDFMQRSPPCELALKIDQKENVVVALDQYDTPPVGVQRACWFAEIIVIVFYNYQIFIAFFRSRSGSSSANSGMRSRRFPELGPT